MHCLDLTLPEPAENLALDEALLQEAETSEHPVETLRLWEPAHPMVVIGRSSRRDDEVDIDTCRKLEIPILRRISGGAAIVAGPGCLMYAVVLSYSRRPALRSIDRAHRFVLDTMAAALEPWAPGVRCRGISDLAVGDMKVSGNSVRCRREHLLYHGTLLYDFPLELIDRCLKMPPRRPDYRVDREHGRFVTNLALSAETIRQALIAAWGAHEPSHDWPRELTTHLAAEKYGPQQWNE